MKLKKKVNVNAVKIFYLILEVLDSSFHFFKVFHNVGLNSYIHACNKMTLTNLQTCLLVGGLTLILKYSYKMYMGILDLLGFQDCTCSLKVEL